MNNYNPEFLCRPDLSAFAQIEGHADSRSAYLRHPEPELTDAQIAAQIEANKVAFEKIQPAAIFVQKRALTAHGYLLDINIKEYKDVVFELVIEDSELCTSEVLETAKFGFTTEEFERQFPDLKLELFYREVERYDEDLQDYVPCNTTSYAVCAISVE